AKPHSRRTQCGSNGRPRARPRFAPEQSVSRRLAGAPRERGNRPGGTILFGHRIEPRRDISQGGPCARRRGRCPQRVCEPCIRVPYLEPRYEVGISLWFKKASEGPNVRRQRIRSSWNDPIMIALFVNLYGTQSWVWTSPRPTT